MGDGVSHLIMCVYVCVCVHMVRTYIHTYIHTYITCTVVDSTYSLSKVIISKI